MRCWARFTKNIYGDESYLTHTLPIEKKTIFISKYLTSIITMLASTAVILIVLFIAYYSKENIEWLKASLNLKSHEKYFLYNREEVGNILNNNVLCCGLKQTEKSSVRYICISIVNFGTSILSDISIENIIVSTKNKYGNIDMIIKIDRPWILWIFFRCKYS